MGLLLQLIGLGLLYTLRLGNPVLYGGLFILLLVNRFIPGLFLLWVIITLAVIFGVAHAHLGYKTIIFAGILAIGMIQSSLEEKRIQ